MPNKSAINLIQAEIAALNSLLKTIDDSFDNVVDLIVNCSGKIIVIGIGKSGHVGNKMAATFASLGTPAFFIHAGDAVHGSTDGCTEGGKPCPDGREQHPAAPGGDTLGGA